MKKLAEALDGIEPKPENQERVFAALADAIERNLDADLISVWTFSRDQQTLRCIHSYDASGAVNLCGRELKRDDAADYFQHIIENLYLNATYAATHPAMREVYKLFSKDLGVQSTLDFVIHKDYVPVGLVCCEARSEVKRWDEEDENQLRQMVLLAASHY